MPNDPETQNFPHLSDHEKVRSSRIERAYARTTGLLLGLLQSGYPLAPGVEQEIREELAIYRAIYGEGDPAVSRRAA